MSPRERNPIGNDARKAARRRRQSAPACAACGATDPEAVVGVGRTLLEFHHVAGGANDPEAGAWLCRNCHAIATEAQRDVGADLRHDERDYLERLEAALRSLGSFLALLADRLLAWADGLADLIATLDAAVPGWRVLTQGVSR
jgi:hypothetical protein